MRPVATRPILQDIDLSKVPHPGVAKRKALGTSRKNLAPAKKTQHSCKLPDPDEALRDGLTDKGRGWALQVAAEKKARERRQQKQQEKKKQEMKIAKSEDAGLSHEEADPYEIEAEPEQEPDDGDAPEHFRFRDREEFTFHSTSSAPKAMKSRTQTPRYAESSPGPAKNLSGKPRVQSSPSPQQVHENSDPDADLGQIVHSKGTQKRSHGAQLLELDSDNEAIIDEDADSRQSDSLLSEPASKKQRTSDGSSKPKAHDYDGITHSMLKMAIAEFQVRICTMNAFPDDEDAELCAGECWKNACDQKMQSEELDERQKKLILVCDSTIRGRIKDKVIAKLVSHYGFKYGNKPTTIQHNKKIAELLLEDDGYVYEDVEGSTGIYDHPILQEVINDQWFGNKKADGITFGVSFNPMPDQALALVFTAVDYAVRQWTSGHLVKGAGFTEALYHETYKRHLSGLDAWRKFNERSAQGLARQKQRLYNHGRCHAGFPKTEDQSKPRFNATKFAHAAEAIREDSEDE